MSIFVFTPIKLTLQWDAIIIVAYIPGAIFPIFYQGLEIRKSIKISSS